MRERVKAVVFREPEGRRRGLINLGFGVLWFVLFLFVVLGGAAASDGVVQAVLGTAFVLNGLAELLPPDRTHLAGGLRVVTALLAGLVLAFVSVNVAESLL